MCAQNIYITKKEKENKQTIVETQKKKEILVLKRGKKGEEENCRLPNK